MKKIFSLISVLLILNGCVSSYKGPSPDFSLTGGKAEEEIKKFSLETDYFSHSPDVYRMGPEHTQYWTSSIDPIISSVSPEAANIRSKSRAWHVVGWALIGVATGFAIAANSSNKTYSAAIYSSLGLSIGSSIYSNILATSAAEQYNRDLRQKFSPQFAVSIPY